MKKKCKVRKICQKINMTLVARCDFYFRLTSYGDFHDIFYFYIKYRAKSRTAEFMVQCFNSNKISERYFRCFTSPSLIKLIFKYSLCIQHVVFLKFKNKRPIFRFLLKTFFFIYSVKYKIPDVIFMQRKFVFDIFPRQPLVHVLGGI